MHDLVLHPTTAKQFKLAIRSPRHAYLFVGPDGLGKTLAAEKFAAELLGEASEKGDLSRWIYVIKPEQGKKISVAQVKEMAKFVNQSKSANVNKKVVIIDNADAIGIEAANSLLQMLEEAPDATVFILVTTNIDSLPPTVLSRLQTIHFYEPSNQQIATFIQENGINPEYLELTGNRPAKLLNPDLLEEQKLFARQVDRYIGSDLTGRLVVSAELTDKAQAENFLSILAHKLLIAQDQFNPNRGESLLLAQSHLYNSGNPKFVLECLALEFE